MFGRGWVKGHGTVVEVLAGQGGSVNYRVAGITDGYIMDIYPDSGEPFRAEVSNAPGHSIFALRDDLKVGETVGVECDPRSKKARLDGSDPNVRSKEMWAKHPSEEDRRKAVLQQPPAPDAREARSSGPGGSASPEGLEPPELHAPKLHSSSLQTFREIQAAHGLDVAGGAVEAAGASASRVGDADADAVEQRLARLEQLRDKGVLSADEYAAQRDRILDSI